MSTSMSSAGRPTYYTIREAAWILGVEPDSVARLIRVGTLRATRRRGQLVIPVGALRALLGTVVDDGPESGGVSR